MMRFANIKAQFASILHEIADDIEADLFESKSIDEFFQEIEISIRYQLGRQHGDEMRYLALDTPVSYLESLHTAWTEKKKQLSKAKKELESTGEAPCPSRC